MPAPLFPHESEYDFVEGKGKRYVEEQSHGGADDWGAEAVGGWAQGGGRGAGSMADHKAKLHSNS